MLRAVQKINPYLQQMAAEFDLLPSLKKYAISFSRTNGLTHKKGHNA